MAEDPDTTPAPEPTDPAPAPTDGDAVEESGTDAQTGEAVEE